jgi:hypothetical protein
MLTSLGATQCYLLSRFGLFDSGKARAAPITDRPTKLLTIYIWGGLQHEFMWSPFYDSAISYFIPNPEAERRAFYTAADVSNLDGSGNAEADAPIRRLRSKITWKWDSPADRNMGEPNNKGYAWAAPEYKLYENTALIHGIDQGTAAHASGTVASLCGIAGGNFAAPSIPAVIANFMLDKIDRPLPSVSIGGLVPAPALDLASAANPSGPRSIADLEYVLSDRRRYWNGLRTRRDVPALGFDGLSMGENIGLTRTDAAALSATRASRGRSNAATDRLLEQLYDAYSDTSRMLAADVVGQIEMQPGVHQLPERMSWAPEYSRFGWEIPGNNAIANDQTWGTEFDLTLKLLQSDMATSVSFWLPAMHNFDSHSATDYFLHNSHLRGAMESLGRLLIEMKLTPSKSRPDRTLLDETLVYITSDFGRTFPIAGGSDHNPMHTAVLVNGMIQGNRMIGGYRENSLFGIPVAIREEDGNHAMRPPTARDVAATIYDCFGLQGAPGTDYFLPGGYGVVEGISPV